MKTANYPIFTIGHSTLPLPSFLSLLERHQIEAIADVRSSPYSSYNPQYNQEALKDSLKHIGIRYVFLGNELGARRSERECYVDGRADYSRIAQTPLFLQGIHRLVSGSKKMRIALLCAEKNPIECHRCILVSPHLRQCGIDVQHIFADGHIEDQEKVEATLLNLWHLPANELFHSKTELIIEAYRRQAEEIAYTESSPKTLTHGP